MNLKGQKVKLRTDEISEIVEQNGKYLHIKGIEKEYLYEQAIKSGFIELIDEDLQRKVMEEINQPSPHSPKILISKGTHFGTNALDAYNSLCIKYGFDNSKWFDFAGRGRPLYASKVTKEGHSVWFIAHSNWTHTTDGHWKNEISDDENLIVENWTEDTRHLYGGVGEKRLVFAKRNGLYEFLGLFQCKNKFGREKIYKKIREHYVEE